MEAQTIKQVDTNAIFDVLEKWIKLRPKLDKADYGCAPGHTRARGDWRNAWRAYNQELNGIRADGKRARLALAEARSLTPAKPELLLDAFRAFSGRLQWKPYPACDIKRDNGHEESGYLEYCTGQYFPTEYRKAAAAVLESYIADWRQWYAREHPREFVYHTIEDVIRANKSIGNHWFDPDTMRFFRTRLGQELYAGKYFITSEQGPSGVRKWSIRVACVDGTIDTLGEFQAYHSTSAARYAVLRQIREDGESK